MLVYQRLLIETTIEKKNTPSTSPHLEIIRLQTGLSDEVPGGVLRRHAEIASFKTHRKSPAAEGLVVDVG